MLKVHGGEGDLEFSRLTATVAHSIDAHHCRLPLLARGTGPEQQNEYYKLIQSFHSIKPDEVRVNLRM